MRNRKLFRLDDEGATMIPSARMHISKCIRKPRDHNGSKTCRDGETGSSPRRQLGLSLADCAAPPPGGTLAMTLGT